LENTGSVREPRQYLLLDELVYDAHPAGRVQDLMERSGAKLNIVVLDACRDNPFHSGSRASGGGLAAMTGGKGTFIAFATSPGKTASDNPNGKNGLFTQYPLDALPEPGLSLTEVFDEVRERVDAASSGEQLPWTLSSVVGRYSFVPGDTTPSGNAPSGQPSSGPIVNPPSIPSRSGDLIGTWLQRSGARCKLPIQARAETLCG
jgi:uncharacterized caspase-like protein